MVNDVADKRVKLRRQIAYGLYDWASSPVLTLQATFIFSVYFTTTVAPENGSVLWSWMISATAVVIAVISPLLGAMADARARRKYWMVVMSLCGGLATALLWFIEPSENYIWLALLLAGLSIIALESVFTFYNALLPSVASPQEMGHVSGLSWGLGYFGSIVCLLIALFVFIMPDVVPWGLDKTAHEHIRIIMPLVVVWFAIWAIPTFLWVPEGMATTPQTGVRETFREGIRAVREIPGLLRFLIARMFYADALVVIFAFGGIYASKVFGFTHEQVIFFAIGINVACGLGAITMGWIEDRIGGFNAVRFSLISLLMLSIGVLIAPNEWVFWVSALALGFFIGPIQSASRTTVARVVPVAQQARIFGLYMISGKATSFLGPLLYGILVATFANERVGMVVAVVFLVIGLVLLGKRAPG